MCDFSVLHYDDWGYTAHCEACGRMQLAFGTVVFSFGEKQYREFVSLIRDCAVDYSLCRDCPQKRIHIRTGDENMLLAFSPREIHRLHDNLQQTLLLQEARGFIR